MRRSFREHLTGVNKGCFLSNSGSAVLDALAVARFFRMFGVAVLLVLTVSLRRFTDIRGFRDFCSWQSC